VIVNAGIPSFSVGNRIFYFDDAFKIESENMMSMALLTPAAPIQTPVRLSNGEAKKIPYLQKRLRRYNHPGSIQQTRFWDFCQRQFGRGTA
jgi:hypothetical protein